MCSSDLVGFVNYWLERMGLDKVGWLTDVDVAMWSMVILTVWWTVGFNFLLYLSSLQVIPDLLYEVAEVDGAGFWRKLWSITLPQLRGTTVLVVTLQVIASLKISRWRRPRGRPPGRRAWSPDR